MSDMVLNILLYIVYVNIPSPLIMIPISFNTTKNSLKAITLLNEISDNNKKGSSVIKKKFFSTVFIVLYIYIIKNIYHTYSPYEGNLIYLLQFDAY